MSFRPAAVIPVYNHHRRLQAVVERLRALALPVIVVDDGSTDAQTRALLAALDAQAGVEVLHLARNRGKGAAVLAGLARAGERGLTHALQVDADGQHDLGDAAALLALARRHPQHLISGRPVYDASVPPVRFYGRYLTHALVWLHTLSLTLRDSMCGYRVYPVQPTLDLAARVRIGARMDFDTDVMVRLYWAGTECLFLPTRVVYPEDGVSHFRMGADNVRMVWLHLRLLVTMWPRFPALLRRTLARRRAQRAAT